MTTEPGEWSRPDAGVDPADYVEDGDQQERHPGGSAGGGLVSEDSPGASLVDDDAGDGTEPNEPA